MSRYKDRIKYWEILNEPYYGCRKWGKTTEESAAKYAEMVRVAYTTAKEVDPNCVIGACGVCSFTGGLLFSKEVFRLASDFIDIFPVHPYGSGRGFGPGENLTSPEKSGFLAKLEMAQALIKKYGSGQKVWVGEIGWMLSNEVSLDSSWAKEWTECMVKTFLLARSLPDVQKCNWFVACDWARKGALEAGLWQRLGLQPRPAVAAYANLAGLLEGVETAQKLNLSRNIQSYAFKKGKGSVIALWITDDKEVNFQFDILKKVKVIDIMGNPVSCLKNGKINLFLSSSPLFVINDYVSFQELMKSFERRKVFLKYPVKMAILPHNFSTIKVKLFNQLNKNIKGRLLMSISDGIKILEPEKDFLLSGGESREIYFQIDRTDEKWLKECIVIAKVVLEDLEIMTEAKISLLTCPKLTFPVIIDGDLSEWINLAPIQLKTSEFILPLDMVRYWEGPKDLSVEAYSAWDKNYFYFAAKVADDKHVNKNVNKKLWAGDSIQIAFDTLNDAMDSKVTGKGGDGYGYDNNDYEYNIALTRKGPQCYVRCGFWFGNRQQYRSEIDKDVKLMIKRVDKYTIYELAIPWTDLTLQPKTGSVFAFNFIVNEDDGAGRYHWIGLTPGIGEKKNPLVFQDVVLQ